MNKKIYIGNISYGTTEDKLREIFAEFGEVVAVNVITDRYTGQSRGFAFVEMSNDEEAKNAIAAMDGRNDRTAANSGHGCAPLLRDYAVRVHLSRWSVML